MNPVPTIQGILNLEQYQFFPRKMLTQEQAAQRLSIRKVMQGTLWSQELSELGAAFFREDEEELFKVRINRDDITQFYFIEPQS